MSGAYDDIINLPHHVSQKHAHMSMRDRAAQFAPFAALNGYDAAVKETARLTSKRIELDEYAWEELNEKLIGIASNPDENRIHEITYFLPDSNKSGGEYVTVVGAVDRVDSYTQSLKMCDGTLIPIHDIYRIITDI